MSGSIGKRLGAIFGMKSRESAAPTLPQLGEEEYAGPSGSAPLTPDSSSRRNSDSLRRQSKDSGRRSSKDKVDKETDLLERKKEREKARRSTLDGSTRSGAKQLLSPTDSRTNVMFCFCSLLTRLG